MERTVRVATGENVAFSYELAGIGSRFLAVMIDLAIQLAVAIVLGLIGLWIALSIPFIGAKFTALGESVLAAIAVVLSFLLFFGYFIVLEWLWDGRTPGKRALRLRVIRDGGFPLDFTASVVRNVVRLIEFSFGFYAISALSALLSPRNRRLGDYAAGTLVIRDERYARAAVLEDSGDPLVADLRPEERDVIARFIARRGDFGRHARARLAAQLAGPLRGRLRADFGFLDDEALLEHIVRASRRGERVAP